MEPATSSAVVQPPPPQPHRVGQAPRRGGWLGWTCLTLVLVVILAFTGCFAAAAYGARHHPRDQKYALIVYIFLLLLLGFVAKLEQLRRDPAATAVNRLTFRFAVWSLLLSLVYVLASRVVRATPVLVTKLLVGAVAAVVVGVSYYYLFCIKDAGCCNNAEHGRARPAAAA